jgi:hypothetical protein
MPSPFLFSSSMIHIVLYLLCVSTPTAGFSPYLYLSDLNYTEVKSQGARYATKLYDYLYVAHEKSVKDVVEYLTTHVEVCPYCTNVVASVNARYHFHCKLHCVNLISFHWMVFKFRCICSTAMHRAS